MLTANEFNCLQLCKKDLRLDIFTFPKYLIFRERMRVVLNFFYSRADL